MDSRAEKEPEKQTEEPAQVLLMARVPPAFDRSGPIRSRADLIVWRDRSGSQAEARAPAAAHRTHTTLAAVRPGPLWRLAFLKAV